MQRRKIRSWVYWLPPICHFFSLTIFSFFDRIDLRCIMKKILVNIFLAVAIIFASACLAYVCILYKELSNSPTFLVHIMNYPSDYYLVQDSLIATWEKYLTIGIVTSSISLFFLVSATTVYNFLDFTKFINWCKVKRNEARKRKIEKLKTKIY